MEPWLAVGGNDELRRWNRLLELTREAKEFNRVNGMLVNKQLAHTQGVLNAMRGPASGAAGCMGAAGRRWRRGRPSASLSDNSFRRPRESGDPCVIAEFCSSETA
jgi:hypothetical protein